MSAFRLKLSAALTQIYEENQTQEKVKIHTVLKPRLSSTRPNRCGVTRKVVFRTHESALVRGGEILTQGARGANHFRAYRCLHCGGYHLSSK